MLHRARSSSQWHHTHSQSKENRHFPRELTNRIQCYRVVRRLHSGDATCSSKEYRRIATTRNGARVVIRLVNELFTARFGPGTNYRQIQKLDWVAEQKRWEAEKAREAPELEEEAIEELVKESAQEPSSAQSIWANEPRTEREIAEAEYILAQEERELQALIAAMEEEQQVSDNVSQHYGSDDDDYDEIFMEVAVGEASQEPYGRSMFQSRDPDAMDMTDG